jgi:hypothetical protein
MSAHPSHDFSPYTGYCYDCTTHAQSLEARYICFPIVAEPKTDAAPPEIDWSGEVTL